MFYVSFQVLRKVFDSFDREKKGSIPTSMVGTIFLTLGQRVDEVTLTEIIAEVDADGKLDIFYNL